jgi:hypothetical protein
MREETVMPLTQNTACDERRLRFELLFASRFLKFAVGCVLDGTTDQLKESLLGRVVFDRGSEYDPRADSIVRVEAQRLRRKLRENYEIVGRDDPVAIKFQPGSYIPYSPIPANAGCRTASSKHAH